MSQFSEWFDKLSKDVEADARSSFINWRDTAIADYNEGLLSMRKYLASLYSLAEHGELDQEEVKSLVKIKKGALQLSGLKKMGITEIELETTRNRILLKIANALITALLTSASQSFKG